MTEPVIRIVDLHKYFGKNEVLKGVSLDVAPGAMGENVLTAGVRPFVMKSCRRAAFWRSSRLPWVRPSTC